MRCIVVILTFIFSFVTYAQAEGEQVQEKPKEEKEEIIKKKMMTFDISKLKDMTLNEVSFVRKSIVEAIFAAKIFEVTFGHVDEKVGKNKVWYEISVAHKKEENGLSHLEFFFKEKPSGQLINYISERNLPRAKVQYRSRVLVYKLMFGRWFNEKTGVLEKPVVVNMENPSSDNIVDDEVPEAQEEVNEENGPDEEYEIKNGKRVKKKKTSEEKKDDKKETPPKSTEKKKVEIQDFDSPNLNLTKNSTNPKVQRKPSLNWLSRFDYSLGYQKETALSDVKLSQSEEVETETSIQRVALKVSSNLRVESWIQHFHYGFVISKVVAEEQYSIPPRLNIFGNFNYDLWSSFLFAGVNMEYDRLGFVNIASRGEGLKAFSSNILWVGFGLRYIDQIKGRIIALEADMKKAMLANSDVSASGDSVPLDGNKLHLQGRVSLYGSWGLGFSYENIALNSVTDSSLDNRHSIFGMYVTYN